MTICHINHYKKKRVIFNLAVMPGAVVDHFIQFSYVSGAARSRRSILQVIWFATA